MKSSLKEVLSYCANFQENSPDFLVSMNSTSDVAPENDITPMPVRKYSKNSS